MKPLIILTVFLIVACQTGNKMDEEKILKVNNQIVNDVHSFANPKESVITHLKWEASVNFDKKEINAIATLSIKNSSDASVLILDTKDLNIIEVKNLLGNDLNYSLGEPVPNLGSPLTINITPDTEKVIIKYTTSSQAEALQWLNPQQTADKEAPFLFTQSQAILARSWVPIQDSPGIRITYEANVKVPSGLLALMSASNPTETNDSGEYSFKMDQPIPAYLLALAVGKLSFKALGPRTGVYAEPSVIDTAAYEFGELESMVEAAESLYGPYQWGRYDLIVLPPSFPFGGMENPRLTFATPTILAGDRSLTSLVAHELAHSWSGNLVTNATWDDFWLNEGFTVYFEQRIMERLYGRSYAEMLASLSNQSLIQEIEQMHISGKNIDTHLKLNLKDRNPDDGMTGIAYDKGYLFLRSLEEKVGREKFDRFLKSYFTNNAFQSMTTEGFLEALKSSLFDANQINYNEKEINSWVYSPGLPKNAPIPSSDRFSKVDDAWGKLTAEGTPLDITTSEWSSHEWLHFVRNIPKDYTAKNMHMLDEAFKFTQTGNSEVLAEWLLQSIKHQYTPAFDKLEDFLVHTGRRKFLMPIYEELVKTEAGLQKAKDIYKKARPNYHFVSTNSIDELLKEKK